MTKIKDIFFQNKNEGIVLSTFSKDYKSMDLKSSMEDYLKLINDEELKGKKIALLVPDVFSYLSLVLAINELGGTIVPLSAQFRKDDLIAVLDSLDPHYVFTVREVDGFSFLDIFSTWAEKSGKETKIFSTSNYKEWNITDFKGSNRLLELEKMDFICCSSGSTGIPKGIVISAETLQFSLEFIMNVNKMQKKDRVFLNAPPNSVFGICALLSGIYSGAQIVFPDRFDLPSIVKLLTEKECNKIITTPSIFKSIYQVASVLNPSVIQKLELASLTGEMITEGILNQFINVDHIEFLGMYGSSEIGGAMYCNLRDKIEFNVGLGIEYKVKEDELLLKSPASFSCYYNNEKLTKEAFDDGWFLTGDLVKVTESNRLAIVGRKKEMIKKGGQQIIPGEIEKFLLNHNQVLQAAVFGVPHKVYGEQIVAYVVLKDTEEVQELYNYCHQNIARIKVPDFIGIIEEMPLIQGKADKLTLKQIYNEKNKVVLP